MHLILVLMSCQANYNHIIFIMLTCARLLLTFSLMNNKLYLKKKVPEPSGSAI